TGGAKPASDAIVAPSFGPTAPPPTEKPKSTKSPADEIRERYGDGAVHLTMFDGEGRAYDTASGAIVARRAIATWVENEPKPGGDKPKGDLWLVATTYRAVAGASRVEVRLRDGSTYKARGLAAHQRERDLVLLALDTAPAK